MESGKASRISGIRPKLNADRLIKTINFYFSLNKFFSSQISLINTKKLAGYPAKPDIRLEQGAGYPVAGYPAKSVSGTSLEDTVQNVFVQIRI